MSDKLLKVGEASRYLGCSQQTLRNYEAKGILYPDEVYPSGHRFYSESSLEEFVHKHMEKESS